MSLSEREKSLLCIAVLTAVSLFAFSECLFNGFLFLDDPLLVIDNPLIRDLSLRGIAHIFFQPSTDLYVPFVLLSYAAEFRFFGLDPMAYHATNVLLHALNVALVFIFLRKFFRSWMPPLAAALVFAVHPLNVEAVAWISERKDVLFFFFSLLALVLHVRQRHAWAFIAVGAALLSKPMAVTLPALFILTDVCLVGKRPREALRAAWPAFVLAAVSAVWTLTLFHRGGHIRPVAVLEWWNMPFYGFASYLVRTFMPVGLSAVYSFPVKGDTLLMSAPYLAAVLTGVLFLLRKRQRLIFGPIFFVIALLPVLQFVPVGHTPVADRYAYLPLVGMAFLFALAVDGLLRRREGRALAAVLVCAVFAPFFTLTFDRCKAWADDARLFGDSIAKYPAMRQPYYCRGIYYYNAGNLAPALADIDRAIAIEPGYPFDYYLRAKILGTMTHYEESLDAFHTAITLCPTCAEFYNDRGVTYGNLGRYDEAATDFEKALEIDPSRTQARRDLEKTRDIIKAIKN